MGMQRDCLVCTDPLWELNVRSKQKWTRLVEALCFGPFLRLTDCINFFLAPTGAQEVIIFIRSSIRPSGPSLSSSLNLHLLGSDSLRPYLERLQDDFRIRITSGLLQGAFREQSDFVIPSEPKILRLVLYKGRSQKINKWKVWNFPYLFEWKIPYFFLRPSLSRKFVGIFLYVISWKFFFLLLFRDYVWLWGSWGPSRAPTWFLLLS